MQVIILCGGAGTRFNNVYPKPLNLVFAHPMIYHVLNKLRVFTNIIFVYNIALDAFGFKQYLINTFKGINFTFIPITFQTRGPAETLLLGLKSINCSGQLLVLDNDNIYEGLDPSTLPKGNFIVYNRNPTGLTHYSFVCFDDHNVVTAIEERNAISDWVCMGGWGFENVITCREFCRQLILQETDETYLSQVFKGMVSAGLKVDSHYLPGAFSLGTEKDILLNGAKLDKVKLRVCFDLDNTLVSWPTQYKDYSSVQRLDKMADFARHLRAEGHEVVIYTARNTVTQGHNVGKVVKNIGLVTLQSLKDLGIEYDEIHFGKPFADIYIDDKAFNAFDYDLMRQIGFFGFMPAESTPFRTNRWGNIPMAA